MKIRRQARRAALPALALFARAPMPGKAKTRLIPLLGAQGSANLQRALIQDATRKLNAAEGWARAYVFVAGPARATVAAVKDHSLAKSRVRLMRQAGTDLSQRLTRAFKFLLSRHRAAVVIGTDSPLMPVRLLRTALRELLISESVLGPCPDGGYYLVGLRALQSSPKGGKFPAAVFRNVRWSTRFAFADTLKNLLGEGLSCSVLDRVGDVDRPADVLALHREFARKPAARSLAPATWRSVSAVSPGR